MYQLVYEISNSICVNNEFGDSVFRTAIRGCDKNYSPDPLCYYLHLKSRILYTVHYFATQATVLQQLSWVHDTHFMRRFCWLCCKLGSDHCVHTLFMHVAKCICVFVYILGHYLPNLLQFKRFSPL